MLPLLSMLSPFIGGQLELCNENATNDWNEEQNEELFAYLKSHGIICLDKELEDEILTHISCRAFHIRSTQTVTK